jgi:hypothetical protein
MIYGAKSLEGTAFFNASLKKGTKGTKRSAYTSLVFPIL